MYLDMECGARSGHLETDGHVFQKCVFEKAVWLRSLLRACILPKPGALMRKWLLSVVENQKVSLILFAWFFGVCGMLVTP